MNIQDAIRMLQEEAASGTNNIVMAYWKADKFGQEDGEKWEDISETLENTVDWSLVHDDMSHLIRQYAESVGLPCVEAKLAYASPSDVSGLPTKSTEN